MRIRTAAAMFTATLLSLVPALRAQTATGQVSGTITDNSGGGIPEATVRLNNEATNIETVRTTNDSGGFTFVNVAPGTYRVRVSKTGFKEAETSVTVGVSQSVTVNARLDVGPVSETVDVTAESSAVQTTTTELGTVI